jgi:hypothetical protein
MRCRRRFTLTQEFGSSRPGATPPGRRLTGTELDATPTRSWPVSGFLAASEITAAAFIRDLSLRYPSCSSRILSIEEYVHGMNSTQVWVISHRMNTTNTTARRLRMNSMISAQAGTRLRLVRSPCLLADPEFFRKYIPSFPPESADMDVF